MDKSFDFYRTIANSNRPHHELMVDDDIKKCDVYLSGDRNEEKGKELHLELITKYPDYISNFGQSLYNYNPEYGFSAEYFGNDALIHNLTAIKNKLIAFKSFGYRNTKTRGKDNSIKIENTLTATQSQSLEITFESVKRSIEEMTGLSKDETKEAIEKVETVKTIIESEESKKTKWQKIKPVLIWLADKSVDVGIAFLPLLLKIGG